MATTALVGEFIVILTRCVNDFVRGREIPVGVGGFQHKLDRVYH